MRSCGSEAGAPRSWPACRPSLRPLREPTFSGPGALGRSNAASLAAARAATVAESGQLRTVRATIRAYAGDAPAVFVDTRR